MDELTWFASAYDTDDIAYRLTTLVQISGHSSFAVGVTAVQLGWVARLGLTGPWDIGGFRRAGGVGLRIDGRHPTGHRTGPGDLRGDLGLALTGGQTPILVLHRHAIETWAAARERQLVS